MMDPTKLLRSLIVAMGVLFLAPLAGVDAGILGVQAAQAQTVGRIDVQGNTNVDDATVVSYLAVRVGEQATGAKITASTESLYGSGLFATVNVAMSGSTLVVRVTENGIVASVLFEGNQRFTDAELLTMVSVGSRGTYSPQRVQTDIESIRQAYDRAGFTSVAVSSRTEAVDNGRTRVIFVINEGVRVGIAAINFTGNNAFAAGNLKDAILTKETGLLSWLFRDDTYSEDKLAADREIIRQYYANRGYPDAQVTSAVAEFDPGRNAYFINFTIVEGERYSFGDIGIETSINGLNTDALTWTIRTNRGSSFNQSLLQRSAEEMAFQATGQGYAFADVRPRLDRDIANRVFNVTYLVDEGARIYVERINITGNEKTRDFVIRRELDFSEGDPFNRSLVTRGKTAIENLSFFQTVNVSTAPGSGPDQVIINIDVVEKSTGEYGLSAGYSTAEGILGEISLTERNFLGRGQYLKVAIGASTQGHTFDFSFTEPRFMGLKVSTGIDLYQRVISESSSGVFYGFESIGGQLRLGVPITDTLRSTFNVGYEQKTFQDDQLGIYDSVAVTDGEVLHKAFVGYSLNFSNVDDTRNPTEGLVANLTQQYAFWDHNFLKTEARARYYTPLFQDSGFVASVRGQAGIINDFSGNGVHPSEAFNKGSDLVRGFASYGYGPTALVNGESIGSTMYAGVSGEIEFPIPILPESYGLSGAVFADLGWVGGFPSNFTNATVSPGSINSAIRSSVGASIIWDSPFGPLRGDFAYALNQSTDDETQLFAVSLQQLL